MSDLEITSMRLGHATNSSSSHSVVFLPGARDSNLDYRDGAPFFGWDHFVIASDAVKLEYLKGQLYENLARKFGKETARYVADALFGSHVMSGSIDHQSVITLPVNFCGDVHYEFFKDLTSLIMQSGIVILGGNDNSEKTHPLLHVAKEIQLPVWRDVCEDIVARKERSGTWILFNRDTGAKIRFRSTAEPGREVQEVEKSDTPELVDIKITDKCHMGCYYCYQNSLPDGRHANHNDVMAILYALSDLKVFEIAIGGGEPVLHPKLPEFLMTARQLGISPNFSTRKPQELLSNEELNKAMDCVGAWGYSVDDARGIERFAKWLSTAPYDIARKAHVHYIVHADMEDMGSALALTQEHGLPIVLLGFKHTGRGAAFTAPINPQWVDVLQQHLRNMSISSISIDSVLSTQFYEQLRKIGIPSETLATREGLTSMYIDAVAMACGPSSFCKADEMTPFPKRQSLLKKEILSNFERWG